MSSLFPPLPVFMDLTGRAAVIAAADVHAARLARECLEAGAGVTLIHPAPCAAAEALSGVARLIKRRWRAADFRNASLVAVGCDERRMSAARSSAKAARAIFLALDGGPDADVSLGDAAWMGPLTVGVSTHGLPLDLARALRARLEAAAPPSLRGFLEAAARFGDAAGADAAARKRFWDRALADALKLKSHPANGGEWEAWLLSRLHDKAA